MKLPIATLLLVSSLTSAAVQSEALSLTALNDLLSHSQRQAGDNARDAARKPAQIMNFSGVARGDHVLDLFAGGGWYSELFSMAVGKQGKVYAQNDNVIWRFAEKRITKRTEGNRLSNLTRLDKIDIAEMDIPENSVDIAFTALNYHDLFYTHHVIDGNKTVVRDDIVDYKAALAKVKSVLKDDGVFVIIDHHGAKGSGYDAPNTVHRIDADIVKYQLAEAGFKLVEEAFYLTNTNDDPMASVFADGVRGNTDRFIYKFMKK